MNELCKDCIKMFSNKCLKKHIENVHVVYDVNRPTTESGNFAKPTSTNVAISKFEVPSREENNTV